MKKNILLITTFQIVFNFTFALATTQKQSTTGADTAFTELKDGNKRFTESTSRHPAQDAARRKELAQGQKPQAIILSCSDSRVPPELIFDKGLGELFTVRVAGNVLGAATVASIEYAVEHLHAKLIVVMGHESCGAVKAAIEIKDTESAGSADLNTLVASIRPNLPANSRNPASVDKYLEAPVKANVDGVAKRLTERSKIIAHAIHTGEVKIVRGIYRLESGKVDFWGF